MEALGNAEAEIARRKQVNAAAQEKDDNVPAAEWLRLTLEDGEAEARDYANRFQQINEEQARRDYPLVLLADWHTDNVEEMLETEENSRCPVGVYCYKS